MANKKNENRIEITDKTPSGKGMYLVRNSRVYSGKEDISYYNISSLISYALFDDDDTLLIIIRAFIENDIDGSTAGLEYIVPLGTTLDEEHIYYFKVVMRGVLNDIFKNRVLDNIRVRDNVRTQIEQIQFTIAEHNTVGKKVITEVLHFKNVAKRLYRLTYSDYELYYLLGGDVKGYDDEYYDGSLEDYHLNTKRDKIDKDMINQLAENVNQELNKDILKKDS